MSQDLCKLGEQFKSFRTKDSAPVTKLYWERTHKKTLDLIYEATSSPLLVLDVGCGTGGTMVKLANKGHKCYGIDPLDEASLAGAKRIIEAKDIDAVIVRAVGENIPFQYKTFDLVLLLSTLQHVFDQNKTLREVKRVLKDDGFVLVSVPTSRNLSTLFRWAPKPEMFTMQFDYNRIENMLESNGFSIVNITGSGVLLPYPFQKVLNRLYRFGGPKWINTYLKFTDSVIGERIISTSSSVIALCKRS